MDMLIFFVNVMGILFMYCLYHVNSYPYCCVSTPAADKFVHKASLNEVCSNKQKIIHFMYMYGYNIWNIVCIIVLIPVVSVLCVFWCCIYCYYMYCDTKYLSFNGAKTEKSSVSKSVAIIGAGPSGLITAKILMNYGHSVTIFEKSSYIGGSFKSSYNGYLTSSTFLTEFSTFPVKKCDIDDKTLNVEKGLMLKFNEYINYLIRFAKTFKS
eukprot:226104_1